jgi:anti-sigma B factor antagonist
MWHDESRYERSVRVDASADKPTKGSITWRWVVQVSLASSTVAGHTVLSVRGEVDMYSAPTLRDRLADLIDSGHHTVIVDLSEVGFLDSTGLGTLVAARTSATESGGALPVVCDQERVLKLFRITGLDSVFDLHASVADAVDALPSTPE